MEKHQYLVFWLWLNCYLARSYILLLFSGRPSIHCYSAYSRLGFFFRLLVASLIVFFTSQSLVVINKNRDATFAFFPFFFFVFFVTCFCH